MNAVDCRTLPDLTEQVLSEFPENELWVCPDTRQVKLLNDPYLTNEGTSLNMIVNACNVVADYAFANYTDSACANQDTILEKIGKIRVSFKMVQHKFDPNYYHENGFQQSVVAAQGKNSLLPGLGCYGEKYSVITNDITFSDNRWGDFAWSGIPGTEQLDLFHVDVKYEKAIFFGQGLV